MDKIELTGLLAGGESPEVAFSRDGVPPDRLAQDLSALLNFRGGRILFGVEEGGCLAGLARSREDFAERVMGVAGRNVRPRAAPSLEFIELGGKVVGVAGAPADNPDTPYRARQEASRVTFMRAGSASRAAARRQEGRPFRSAGVVRRDLEPVPGAGPERLGRRRVENYSAAAPGRPRRRRGPRIPAARTNEAFAPAPACRGAMRAPHNAAWYDAAGAGWRFASLFHTVLSVAEKEG